MTLTDRSLLLNYICILEAVAGKEIIGAHHFVVIFSHLHLANCRGTGRMIATLILTAVSATGHA